MRSKIKNSIRESMLSAMEIPADLAYRDFVLTFTGGRQALVENYRSVLFCRDDRIIVEVRGGRLVLAGEKLVIQNYTGLEMVICGKIREIHLEKQGDQL